MRRSSVSLAGDLVGDFGALVEKDGCLAVTDDAARTPHHQHHHRKPEHQHAVLLEFTKQFEPADHGEGCQRDAELRTHAAEHDDCEHQRQTPGT